MHDPEQTLPGVACDPDSPVRREQLLFNHFFIGLSAFPLFPFSGILIIDMLRKIKSCHTASVKGIKSCFCVSVFNRIVKPPGFELLLYIIVMLQRFEQILRKLSALSTHTVNNHER